MFFRRFEHRALAQVSYLVGCQATGEALVVDPNRDIEQYVDAAADEGLRITHVTETHVHADFVSGSRDLAQSAGARLLLSGMGGSEWRYRFADEPNVELLRDGDRVLVGNIAIDVMHTPGHTPEHLAFVLTDTPASAGAMGIFTGDFLFVGDVGRPDLLERAVGHAGTMDGAARDLYRSLQRLAPLPDHLQLWPGHGAGSACGKSLGAVPTSTLGYERRANWALQPMEESAFVRAVLDGQPAVPAWFAEMKRINLHGAATLDGVTRSSVSPEDALRTAARDGALIVDVRQPMEWARGHLPGASLIPLPELVARLDELPRGRRIVVHCQAGSRSAVAASLLIAHGFRDVADMAGGFAAWSACGLPIDHEPG